MSAYTVCVYTSNLKFLSFFLQGKRVGSANEKRVQVRRQEDRKLAVSLLT